MGAPDLHNSLSASLTVTPEIAELIRTESGALEEAKTYVIDSQEMAQAANVALKDIKRRLAAVETWRERFMSPIRQLTENANALFNPPRESLGAAETHLKKALTDWTNKEAARVEAERQAAEEAARKARQEAEAKAAALRAKAEEEAREARQRAELEEKKRAAAAQEAERLRQAAAAESARLRAEGDAKAAAAAEKEAKARAEEQERLARESAAERARQEEAERKRTEDAERKARQLQMEAAAEGEAARKAASAAPVALAGFSTRDNWCAVREDGKTEDEAKLAIATAIAAGRSELLVVLKLDTAAVNRLAKAQKQHTNIPGFRAVNNPVATSRK